LYNTTKIIKPFSTNQATILGSKKSIYKPKSSPNYASSRAYEIYKNRLAQQRKLTKLGKTRVRRSIRKKTTSKRFSPKHLLATSLPFRTRLRLFNTLSPQQKVIGLNHFASFKQAWGFNFHVFGVRSGFKCLHLTDLSHPNNLKLKPLASSISTNWLPRHVHIFRGNTEVPSLGKVTSFNTSPTLNPYFNNMGLVGSARSSIASWFFLKKRLKRYIRDNDFMPLGLGSKHFILGNSIFYPHSENIIIFRNLVFCSFSPFTTLNLKYTVSHAGVLNLLPMRKKIGRGVTGTNSLLINMSFLSSLIKIFFSARKFRRGVLKRRRSRRFYRKSNFRIRVFKLNFRQLFWKFKRLRRKILKSKILVRRFLGRIRRKLNTLNPIKIKFLKKYEMNRFFVFTQKRNTARPGINVLPKLSLSTANFLFTSTTNADRHNFFSFLNCRNYFLSKEHSLLMFFVNPFFFKMLMPLSSKVNFNSISASYLPIELASGGLRLSNLPPNNIMPSKLFKSILTKKILATQTNSFLNRHAVPWVHTSLIRFMESCSGKKVFIQFYSFITQNVDPSYLIIYRRWMPRMKYYEQRLGHKFFLGEALSIIHLSFTLHDPKLLISWFSAIIKRISFWKTRLVFRFFRYLIQNYFSKIFSQLNVKGIKVKLKGKISVSGNSRKRTILYRSGSTSHSTTSLRVLHESTLINTFTGVMGFQMWIFY